MACNRNDSRIRETTAYQEITLWMDHETTKEVARKAAAGAAGSAIITVLAEAGVVTAPIGWAAGLISIVLGWIAADLSMVDEGCGVKVGMWQPQGSSNPNYVYEAQ